MKKHLFICYNKIHYLQFLSFQAENSDLVYVFAPAGIASDVALCYDSESFSPGSFSACVKNTDLVNLIDWCVQEGITDVYITCLHFPFSNLLAGTLNSLAKTNFHMFYDGWQNIIPEKLSGREKARDYLKATLARFFKLKYIIRRKFLAGFDSPIFVDQHLSQVEYLKKTGILNFEPVGEVKKNVIYYVCQYNHVIGNEYLSFFHDTIDALRNEFPVHDIVLLLRPGVDLDIFKGFNIYHRDKFSTAEEICAANNPEIIASQASSTLFNLVTFGRPNRLVSVGLERYCETFEPHNFDFYREFFDANKITRLRLFNE